jgi:hypothetical protein
MYCNVYNRPRIHGAALQAKSRHRRDTTLRGIATKAIRGKAWCVVLYASGRSLSLDMSALSASLSAHERAQFQLRAKPTAIAIAEGQRAANRQRQLLRNRQSQARAAGVAVA